MRKITVNASETYDVVIGGGLAKKLGEYANSEGLGKKAVVVSDSNVAPLYANGAMQALENAGYEVYLYVFKSGEQSKCGKTYFDIMNFLAEKRISRTDTLYALGGGVTGDLTGFCAATYMRGVNYVQLPTSLLAAVDSSVGGKTAIDLDGGKNLCGAFYQPRFVLCDTKMISTLPEKYFSDGCAEIIKYAFIKDKELCNTIKSGIKNNIEDVIARCVRIKADIVKNDEHEHGERRLLNFGHTVGHAAETLSHFEMGHGEGVAVGMYTVTNALEKMKAAKSGITSELLELLKMYSLPHKAPFSAEEIFQKTAADKKCENDGIYLVTVGEIGHGRYEKIPMSRLKEIIEMGLE